MNYFVWHVGAPDFDVDAFLEEFPQLKPHAEPHRRGEIWLGKKVFETSGFTVGLSDKDTLEEALAQAHRVFSRFEAAAQALHSRGVSSMLDLGITVGTREAFVRNVYFDVHEMEYFARIGVALAVTAYPCADDEDPDPEGDPAEDRAS